MLRLRSSLMLERADGSSDVHDCRTWPPWLATVVAMNRNLGALPMVAGNTARLIENYTDSIEAMIDDIDRLVEVRHQLRTPHEA